MLTYQTKKKEQYYDKVIEARFQRGYSVGHLAKIYSLSKNTISRWIANFAEDNPEVQLMGKKQKSVTAEREERQNLPDDVKALQAELMQVREELRKERLRADAYDTMIDIAEGMFKVPIRKKTGAKR